MMQLSHSLQVPCSWTVFALGSVHTNWEAIVPMETILWSLGFWRTFSIILVMPSACLVPPSES